MAALLMGLAFAAPASAVKAIGGFVGAPTGGQGGQFSAPRDVAVSQTGAGAAAVGDIYIADSGNHRIQVLDANGNFKFAFGRDVIAFGNVGDLGDVLEKCAAAAQCKAGSTGTAADGPGGEFDDPHGAVLDPITGDVYVRDRDNRRIQQFDAAGNFIRAFGWDVVQTGGTGDDTVAPVNEYEVCSVASQCQQGSTGTGAGQFATSGSSGAGLALGASGSLFSDDRANRRVNEFDATTGIFVRAWGYGVDTGANTEFQVCTTASTCQAGVTPTSANANGSFATSNPLHLAVDSQNVVYASDTASSTVANRIIRFDADGAPASGNAAANLLQPINPTTAPAFPPAPNPLLAGATLGLEIDPDTDGAGADEEALDIVRDPSSGNTVVQELDIPTDGGAGELPGDNVTVAATHAFAVASSNGLGIDASTENIYLPGAYTGTGQPGHGMFVLVESPGVLGAVTINPASNVGSTTADLSGTLDPNAGAVSYQFEVSADGTNFTPVAKSFLTAPAGAQVVAVSATGLDPNSAYRTRLVVTKQTGLTTATTIVSSEAIFTTDAASPEAITLPVGPRTATTAELRGTVDPNGTATTYWFEYGGDTGYGTKIPVFPAPAGGGNEALTVVEQVSGLLPSTTYHYRIVADGFGPPVAGADRTFTTQAALGPVAPLDDREYELVSPAYKLGGVGVGNWQASQNFINSTGFAGYSGERFAAQGGQGSILVDSAQAFANDWAFAQRDSDQVGWQSHSPFTHPAQTGQLAKFVHIQAATDDLSRLAWRTNNTTISIFPETLAPGWPSAINPTFLSDWLGRWEIFGPTAVDQVPHVDISNALQCDSAFSSDGKVATCSTDRDSTTGRSSLRGLAGAGDPTAVAWPDLIGGRSVYLADLSSGLADAFGPGAGRTLANVCTGSPAVDRTEIPSVDGSSNLTAAECPVADGGRDARLISDRGATMFAGDVQEGVTGAAFNGSLANPVSADGSRVFFISPDPLATGVPNGSTTFCATPGGTCPTQLYVRQRNVNGTITTRWISRAAPGLFGSQDSTLTGTVRFEGATPDGDKIFLRTNSPLTADDPNRSGAVAPPGGVTTGTASSDSWDLYMYDMPDGPDSDPATPDGDPAGGQLTRISAGPPGGDDGDCNVQPGSTADPLAALRFASVDGSRVYFTCAAPLPDTPAPADGTVTAPGGTPATTNATNLYLYDAGRPVAERWRFVARLPRSVSSSNAVSCASAGTQLRSPLSGQGFAASNCVRGTLDGGFVTLWTTGRLTASDPDDVTADIYGYDADTDVLTRITAPQGGIGGTYPCGTSGDAAATPCYGDAGYDYAENHLRAPKPILGVATDPLVPGDNIAFFQSKSRLVPGDTDSLMDVYQWRNGELSLISTGANQTRGSYLRGNDASGRNVFFATMDALTWQDFDAVYDVYTARAGGGILEPADPPVCGVLLDACQPAGEPQIAPPSHGSAAGGGNAPTSSRVSVSVAAPGRDALRRATRSGVLRLRVTVSAPGQIRVTGSGRIGKRRRAIAAARSVSIDGTSTVRLRLTRAARAWLRKGRPLNAALEVTMPGARTRRVTVRLPGASR